MSIGLFLNALLTTAAIFLFLWRSNYPRPQRYKQAVYPLAAIITSAYAIYLYFKHQYILQQLMEFLARKLLNLTITPPTDLGYIPVFTWGLIVVFLFAVIKFFLAAIYTIATWLGKIKRKLFKKKKKDGQPVELKRQKPSLAYRYDLESRIILKEQWEPIFLFLKTFGWIAAGVVLLAVIGLTLFTLPIAPPEMAVLALLIVLEGAWYLNGPRPGFYKPTISAVPPGQKQAGDYSGLWQEYQQTWKDKLLIALQYPTPPNPVIKTENLFGLFKQSRSGPRDENTDELKTSAAKLLNRGYRLTAQDCEVLRELYRYKDIIIADAYYNHVAPVVVSALIRSILRGYNILVIIPYGTIGASPRTRAFTRWLKEWFAELGGQNIPRNISCFNRGDAMDESARVLIANAGDLLESKSLALPWFENVRTVVFIDVTEVFARDLTITGILLSILRAQNQHIQCLVLADYRQALEPSIRRNLDIANRSEKRLLMDGAANASVLAWSMEGPGLFQHKILTGNIENFLGAEAVLALLPWRDNLLDSAYFINQEDVCWQEYLEELENRRDALRDHLINDNIRGSNITKTINCSPISDLTPRRDRMIVFSRDREYNLVTNIRKTNSYAHREVLSHVISPPYLLRDYLADNFQYFRRTPLFPLTAKMMISKFSLAFSLMERLILYPKGLSEQEILAEIHRVNPCARDARRQLVELFKLAFDIDINAFNYLTLNTEDVFEGDQFEKRHLFVLSPEIKKSVQLEWLRPIRIDDNHNKTLDEIYFDHLYQNYLPGQIHAFSQKTYQVEEFDRDLGILRVSPISPANITAYRPQVEVRLNHIHPSLLDDSRRVQRYNRVETAMELCEADFEITTTHYYYKERGSLRQIQIEGGGKERSYTLGRVLTIHFTPAASGLNSPLATSSLVVLLKEILLTFFPETHQYMIVCGDNTESVAPQYRMLVPRFSNAGKTKNAAPSNAAPIRLYLFEDSHQDLGLLQSVFDQWKYIFSIMDDYITWVSDADNKAEDGGEDRRKYLRFHFDDLPPVINLQEVSRFLRDLVGDNPDTRARLEFYQRPKAEETGAGTGIVGGDVRQCDFCAGPLPSAGYDLLEDGRERCPQCSANTIENPERLETVYREAREFLRTQFKVEPRQEIGVEFISAKEISESIGQPFVSTPAFDPRTVGLTVFNSPRYTIKIENGSPYHLTLAITVHELVHIWQKDYLDMPKMTAKYSELLIEGLAVWAELYVLEINNMAAQYRQAIAGGEDKYGKGYRTIVEMLEKQKQYADPFRMLMDLFPKPAG